jgi:hypothetical protein
MTSVDMVRTMAETPGVSQAAVVSSIVSFVGQLTRATDAERQQLATQLGQVQGTEAILSAVADHLAAAPRISSSTPIAPEVAMPMVKEIATTPMPQQVSSQDIGRITDNLMARFTAPSDNALLTNPGGINLSNEHLTLNVKVDGAGMPLPPQYQDQALMKLDGLVSIIRSITPVTQQNVPALYELAK